MTDMIEKMARAMCDAQGDIWEYTVDEPNKNTPLYSDSLREMYLAHAKAALSALEDPSEEMVGAVQEAEWPDIPSETHREMLRKRLRSQWSAMIQAAKAEAET
jgi:hypothetical protein